MTINDFNIGLYENLGANYYHYQDDKYEFYIQMAFDKWYVQGFDLNERCLIPNTECSSVDECLEVINRYLHAALSLPTHYPKIPPHSKSLVSICE